MAADGPLHSSTITGGYIVALSIVAAVNNDFLAASTVQITRPVALLFFETVVNQSVMMYIKPVAPVPVQYKHSLFTPAETVVTLTSNSPIVWENLRQGTALEPVPTAIEPRLEPRTVFVPQT